MWNHSRSPEHKKVRWMRSTQLRVGKNSTQWDQTAAGPVLTMHVGPRGWVRCPCASWSSCPLSVSVSLCLCLSLTGLSRLQIQMAPFLCSTHFGVSSLYPLLCDSTMAVLESTTTCRWFRKPSWLNCPNVTSRMKRSSWKWYSNCLLGDHATFSVSLSLFSPPLSVLTKKAYNANIIYNLRV